jgi:hypothetical protein
MSALKIRSLRLFAPIASGAAAVWVHWPATRGGFTLDDKFSIVRNPTLRARTAGAFARAALASDYWGTPLDHPQSHQSFRPVTTWSFWLDLRGRPPAEAVWQLHATSVALHAVAAAMVAVLARQLLDSKLSSSSRSNASARSASALALFAGLVFAVHPVTVEAVASLSGRAEILAALFGLSAHLLALHDQSFLGLLLATAAVFSKEVGFTAVVVVVVHAYFVKRNHSGVKTRNRLPAAAWRCLATAIAVIAMAAGFRLWFLHHRLQVSDTDNPLWSLQPGKTRLSRWLSTCFVNAKALGMLLLFPIAQCPDYSGQACPSIDSVLDARNLTSIAACSFAVLLVYGCTQQSIRATGPALLWAALPAALASNIFLRVGFCFAERVYYSSLVGVSLLLCLFAFSVLEMLDQRHIIELSEVGEENEEENEGGEKKEKTKKKKGVIQKEHASSEVRESPYRGPTAHRFLLAAFAVLILSYATTRTLQRTRTWASNADLWSSAVRHCEPTSRIVNNFGKVLQRSGKSQEAWVQFERARALDPTSALPYFNLGMLAAADQRHQEALLYYRQASKRNPYLVGAFNNAGASHLALGDKVSAAVAFEQALKLNPSDQSIRANLRIALRI